jgi:cytochrome o ubiquinol oxidase operon protein cyoD
MPITMPPPKVTPSSIPPVRFRTTWTMMALIFTIIMVAIALTGSLWVMHHLNLNMMPMHDMRGMP